MTTKEKIILAALELFSKKGYDGTSVKDIAGEVGIKDSSLYKHFKSKQEIFETMLHEMCHRVQDMSEQFQLPDADCEDVTGLYAALSEDDLVALSKKIYLFYLQEPLVSKFRKLLNQEQYKNETVAKAYRNFFMEESIRYQTEVCRQMIAKGAFIDVDPEVMAGNFYAPIFFLLNKYDTLPERWEEGEQYLERHIREFVRIYRKESK